MTKKILCRLEASNRRSM